MKKNIFKSLYYLLFLSIGILLLYNAFNGGGEDSSESIVNTLKEVIAEIKNAKYSWVFIALLAAFLAHLSRAYRWRLLIEPLNHKPSLLNCFYAVMTGYLANYAFPRLGEVTRCASLKKTENISFKALIGTVIAERTMDMLMLIFLLIAIFFIKIGLFGKFIKENIFHPFQEKINSFLDSYVVWLFLFAGLILIIFIYHFMKSKYSDIKAFRTLKNLYSGVLEGLKTILRMKKRGEFIFHTLFIWAMYLLMTYLIFFSFSFTSDFTLIDGLFIMVIGSLGFAAPVQGGIGVYHWLVKLGLMELGTSESQGLSFATLCHGSQSLFAILLGALSLLILFISDILKSNAKQ